MERSVILRYFPNTDSYVVWVGMGVKINNVDSSKSGANLKLNDYFMIADKSECNLTHFLLKVDLTIFIF
jgi:hypothetical protein